MAAAASPQASVRRLVAALLAYALLAIAAGLTLDGVFRSAVWLFLAGLGLKTWLAWRTERTRPHSGALSQAKQRFSGP